MFESVLAQQSGAASPGAALNFLPIVLIIGIFYLLIYRPMRRRQKSLETMVANLKNGDKVITSGGVHGTVAGVKENTVMLKVADQVKLEVAKSAIASMQMPPKEST
jgi:preprotein translocase subunit YajC